MAEENWQERGARRARERAIEHLVERPPKPTPTHAIPTVQAQCPMCWRCLDVSDQPEPVGLTYTWYVSCECGWSGEHEVTRRG